MTFNLGNFADGLSKVGKGLMQNANFYGRAKMALHNSNQGCCGPSIWGGGYISGGCCGGLSGGYMGGAYSPYNGMAINMAYNQGYGSTMEAIQRAILGSQQPAVDLPDTDNPAADAVDTNTDTAYGAIFEESEKTGGALSFAKTGMAEETDASKKQEIYNDELQKLGKSLLMHMDKTSGNTDGYVTAEEFLNHETKDMTEEQKTQNKAGVQTAFNQMDQNGDGKIDWKEMSSAVASYDADGDGEITKEEFQTGGGNLLSGKASTSVRTAYQRLFGTNDDEA